MPSSSKSSLQNRKTLNLIDFEQHKRSAELERFGLDHLKTELTRQKLKCGGSLEERGEPFASSQNEFARAIDVKAQGEEMKCERSFSKIYDCRSARSERKHETSALVVLICIRAYAVTRYFLHEVTLKPKCSRTLCRIPASVTSEALTMLAPNSRPFIFETPFSATASLSKFYITPRASFPKLWVIEHVSALASVRREP